MSVCTDSLAATTTPGRAAAAVVGMVAEEVVWLLRVLVVAVGMGEGRVVYSEWLQWTVCGQCWWWF